MLIGVDKHIPYEHTIVNNGIQAGTVCPYNQSFWRPFIIYVGSTMCTKCRYFKQLLPDKVVCRYLTIEELKAIGAREVYD